MFDGDQMAVYLPVTEKAQKICREKLLVGCDYSSSKGDGLNIAFKKDMVLGLWAFTKDYEGPKVAPLKVNNVDEAIQWGFKCSDAGAPVIYNGKQTTAGRFIFEQILGAPCTERLNKKKFSKIVESLVKKPGVYPEDVYDKVKDMFEIACKFATLDGKSIDIMNYNLKPEFKKRRDEIFKSGIDIPNKLKQLTLDMVDDKRKNDPDSFLSVMVDSGAESKMNNIQSSFIAKGFVNNIDGEVIPTPVKSSTGEGLSSSDYFQTSISGRSGLIDRSVNTRVSGYLFRQLVYATASVKLDTSASTIKCYKPFLINVKDDKIASWIDRRTMMNGKIITDAKSLIGQTVGIVSPLYWTTRNIGLQCLPDYLYPNLRSTNIGILAAQCMGERGTQLTMQTFHMTSSAGFANFLKNDEDLVKVCTQDKEGMLIAKVPIIVRYFTEDVTDKSPDGVELIFRDMTIESTNTKIELSLDYDFTLIVNDKDDLEENENDGSVTVRYGANDIFGSMKNSAGNIVGALGQIQKMSNSRVITNPEKMTLMMTNLFDGVPMWAVEIFVSQLFRDPKDPSLPYRCGSHNGPVFRCGIKQVSMYENWRRGAAFENVSLNFQTAVLNDNDDMKVRSDLDDIASM